MYLPDVTFVTSAVCVNGSSCFSARSVSSGAVKEFIVYEFLFHILYFDVHHYQMEDIPIFKVQYITIVIICD